jgi:cell division transport system ATP-binding protein
MITFTEVTKSFEGRAVLDKVSFSVDPGEFVCITGPSGAGKSTVVQLLVRALAPDSGVVEVDGVDLAKLPPNVLQMYRRRTGVMFQDYRLLQHLTVEENIAFAMEVCGDPDELIDARLPEVLEALRLEDCADAFPRELSGGEQARTALARAIVHQPMILIADEPTGNIDPEQSVELMELLKAIHREGVTVVLATHDQAIVDALQTRVLRLERGKLVRDAVGGYATPIRPASGAHTKKHKILDAEPAAVPAEPVAAAEPQEEEPAKKAPSKKAEKTDAKPAPHASGRIKPIAIGE